jgi:decaprenylphospho-beta-D-ribofuranose 2-oxidase
VPPGIPVNVNLVSRGAVSVFNEVWFRKAPRLRERQLQTAASFFHPLDAVADWNRVYGRRGVVQYQLVVPDGAEAGLKRALERLAEAGHPSFLSVLKRFGPGTPGPLSFPIQGWTLAVDLAARPGIATLLQQLDDLVVDHGGRVYLAKDSRATPQTIAKMYPTLDDFRRLRARVDPDRLFVSDLSRRLEL